MPPLRSSTPSLCRDVLRQIIREELQAFGHRMVYFLMRIAFSAEQAKLLITNVLKFVLKLAGIDQKTYVTLVDESGNKPSAISSPTPRNSKPSLRNGKRARERRERGNVMAIFKANYVKRGTTAKALTKASVRYIQHRRGKDGETDHPDAFWQ